MRVLPKGLSGAPPQKTMRIYPGNFALILGKALSLSQERQRSEAGKMIGVIK